ncbi:hypothetical protein VTJ49DRAFT_709 [Mycothermus thermophilus]|uniref:Dihydrofolate synthetase n=1 Tax=Humicola insolens TaxID=85995 RepID=A0ABR3VGI6_HUMIN
MIDLGLARVGRLVQQTPQTWKAIHVAGTNGKGSICAYLSAMLVASGRSCARFTSPHLIDRWDCIAINGKPIPEAVFTDAEAVVKQRDADGRIGATEFELLTATAFEIFHRQRVEYGVVEVGLGGRLDATNVLKQKAVTVIAKIGLDHQSFLGNTIEEIALEKAGIMRPGVPCVVDGSNQPSVLEVLEEHARCIGTELHLPSTAGISDALDGLRLEPHQIQNLACAHLAFRLACPEHDQPLVHFLPAIRQLEWPGRLQKLNIQPIINRPQEVLLDGAHNPQSAEVLAHHLIVVCGHAIWLGGPKNGWDEAEWLIEEYKKGETPTFIEHIKAGVKLLSEDEDSVLVFSGGPTRKEIRLSEARSYYNIAVANTFFNLLPSASTTDANPLLNSRILLEERALDSYANILLSLITFWRHHSCWPMRLTIVSHGFKRVRLVDGHCAAIGFPLERVRNDTI